MKILYAASNNLNAKIQLTRFLKAMQGSKHQIKVAAFKLSSPEGINIDWTLDCLLNIYRPELMTLDNDNLRIYYEQVKYYEPDLIISDLEYFTSYIANVLNIKVWQCSSSLVNIAMERSEKYNLGVFKHFSFLIERDEEQKNRTLNLLENSNGNFVYSHFGDTEAPPKIREGFEWVRPYHQVGKYNVPCQHFIIGAIPDGNKELIAFLRKQPDAVVFVESPSETYSELRVKDIKNAEEYFCNLQNCGYFLCQGQTSFLADAYYNGKWSIIYPDYEDAEAVLNSAISRHLKLSRIIDLDEKLGNRALDIKPSYNPSIKFLHEKVNEL